MCGPEIHAIRFSHNMVTKYFMNSAIRSHEGLRVMMAELSRQYREVNTPSPFPDAYAYTTEVGVSIDDLFDFGFIEDSDLVDYLLLVMHGIYLMGEDIGFGTLVTLALKRQEIVGQAEPLGDVLDMARDCVGDNDYENFARYFYGEAAVNWVRKNLEKIQKRSDEIFDYDLE